LKSNAVIITLAYPDTFVRVSEEFVCKIFPILGVGTKEYLKAGHAALVLVKKETGEAFYFDFGRYVTPFGKGRVRGFETDRELKIPIKGCFDAFENLSNIEDFLLFLEAHPEKTHGKGKLIASVSDGIHFETALHFIKKIQSLGSIPYGGFIKDGSNCSRFVTDSILNSTTVTKVKSGLKRIKMFTPSPLGNVAFGSIDKKIFHVENGNIYPYNKDTFLDNLTNFFDKKHPEWPPKEKTLSSPEIGAQYLDGIGAGAWFSITVENALQNLYRIKRYADHHLMDFDGVFSVDNLNFSIEKEYRFVYDSHCLFCHIKQNERIYRFDFVRNYDEQLLINSTRKVRSA